MPRIELLPPERAPLSARRLLGERPGPFAASWAHVPELLAVALPFVGRALGPSSVEARRKEIAILRASALMECRYCVLTHTAVALDSGLSREQVAALRGEAPLDPAFPEERDRALVAWTDAVAGGRGPIPAERFDDFRRHFDEAQVAELTMVVCATIMLNRYATALELPVHPDTLARLAREGLA